MNELSANHTYLKLLYTSLFYVPGGYNYDSTGRLQFGAISGQRKKAWIWLMTSSCDTETTSMHL